MKILMHVDSLGSGGAQRQIAALGHALSKRGHEVAFNTYFPLYHFSATLNEADIEVRSKTKTSRLSIGPIRNLITHARDMRADAIIAFLRTPAIHAEIAGRFLPKCKIIVSERASYPEGSLPRSLWLKESLHRFADFVTVNSSHQAHRMQQEFPWMVRKLRVIRNGYEFNTPAPYDGSISKGIRLLTLASIIPGKDPLSLAKALRICRQDRNIPVHIDWAGERLLEKGICPPQMETDAYLAEHGITDNWTWLGLQRDVVALFRDRHALIHTSLAEGFSNAIAEALVNGRPVLIGRVGDQPDVVEESRAGLLFNVADPESIADAITRFYRMSDGDRVRMGQAGRRYAKGQLTMAHMVDEYETLLRQLAGQD